MINVNSTFLSQYDNARTLTGIITTLNNNIDPRTDIQNFYDHVFNIDTAQGFGLDIWGRILGVGRELRIISSENWFGFDEALTDGAFGELVFQPYGDLTQTYALSDDAYRSLLIIKAMANIASTTAGGINALLLAMFSSRGRAYAVKTGTMAMRYVFEFALTPVELSIVVNSGVLPIAGGVKADMMVVPRYTFGFAEAGAGSFGDDSFISLGAVNAIN